MKFALFSLVANLPNPRTGEHLTAAQKFENVIRQAVLAEALGFEAYGVGERHGAPLQPQTAFAPQPGVTPVFQI